MVRVTLWTIAVIAWLSASALCFARLWRYQAEAGPVAQASAAWPEGTSVLRDAHLPTLVVLMHPKCPCSRASVEELAKLMANAAGKVAVRVLMVRPAGVPQGWEQTDLWRSAAAIPGVTVLADADGAESRRFGAATSGHALLYSLDGRLLFAGGITGARGHNGDNEGRSLVVALARAEFVPADGQRPQTPVYGCPLFSDDDDDDDNDNDDDSLACQAEGTHPCPK